MKVTITTFNLRLNVKSDKENAWPSRLSSVIKYIKTTQPMILSTQEILDGMLEDLSMNLPNYSNIGVTRKQNEEACPIFYNHQLFEVKESGTFWLSKTPFIPNTLDYNSACHRICTWAEFMVKTNRNIRFRVFNTHLDHISHEARTKGIEIIYQNMASKNKIDALPTILTGDFNSTIQEEPLSIIKNKGFIDAFDYLPKHQYGATFHNFTGITDGVPIDYIFLTPDIKVDETQLFKNKIDNHYPSDHYPVITYLEIKEPN